MIDYKIRRQTSRQWRNLLSATTSEMAGFESKEQLRAMMVRIGNKFAIQADLPEGGTLDEYEKCMCGVWDDMDWGWVELKERGDALQITHHCSTHGRLNSEALSDASEVWVSSFLEGVYQQWVSQMGAGEKLQLKQAGIADEFGTIEYVLSV